MPPLLILGVSVGLFAYRLSVSDWYWGAAPIRKSGPTLARADRSGSIPIPSASSDRPVENPTIEPRDSGPSSDQPPPTVEPAEPRPDAIAQGQEPTKEEDPEESIRLEAERARNQRDEIARFKEQEADRLDRNPPRPEPQFRGLNPAQIDAIRRQQLAIQRRMDAMMEAQMRQFGEMFRGRQVQPRRQPARPPLPWGELGEAAPNPQGPGFLPMMPPEIQAEMDRMFEDVFRMQARPGNGRAQPAPAIPAPRRPPQPQQAPQNRPADEIDPRFFT